MSTSVTISTVASRSSGADGAYLTQWGLGRRRRRSVHGRVRVAVDAAGNVYVGEYDGNRIQKVQRVRRGAALADRGSGEVSLTWGTNGGGNGQFNSPAGIATDAAGNVYVSDIGLHRIQKFTLQRRLPDAMGLAR